MRLKKRSIRFLEFALIGVVMGTFEDTIAVYFVTGEKITFDTIWIVFLVALPFAFLSEYVVDHPKFWKKVLHLPEEENPPTGSSRGES